MDLELADPEKLGFSPERLARVDEHLRRYYIEPGKIAGASTLVARRGEVVHFSPLGRMDIERDKPMREDTIFRVYSMTKPITSVALMTLYEEGRLRLSDPVHKFVPAFEHMRVYVSGKYPLFMTEPARRPITLHDLLTHTAGLTYGFMYRGNVDDAYRKLDIDGLKTGATLADRMEKLATLPLEFSPGTAWNYSVATDLVGHVVEKVSGQSLDRFVRARITEPLGMVDSGFTVRPSETARFAANYTRRADKSLRLIDDPLGDSPWVGDKTFFSGGGGMVSTAADYLRFCRMLLNGGELDGVRILGRKTVELMTMNHLPGGVALTELTTGLFSEVENEGTGFGLGFSVNLNPVLGGSLGSVGEFAWGGMASTIFWIDPREELIAIFMTQLVPSRTFDFRGQLRALIYSSLV
jgi:CubicO group peptidase (beta-lactamase class C family)